MTEPWFDQVPLPALLRGAWATYGKAIRAAMAEAGFDDLPRNGPYVVGALAHTDLPLARIVDLLGVSKQAAGQLIDALVTRGYLERAVDPGDRRRLTISTTPRGRAAAAAAQQAIARVDRALSAEIGDAALAATRRTLAAIMTASAHLDAP